MSRNVLDVMDGGVEFFAYSREDFPRLVVIPRANLRARFLQAPLRLGGLHPWSAQFFQREACRLGGLEARLELIQPRGDVRDRRIGRALGSRLGVTGLADGVLGALAGVDGVAQGLTVIALVDGGARLLQARRRGGVFLGSVCFGPRRARELDGGLRLVDLFLRRLGAARKDQQQGRDAQRDPRPKQRRPRPEAGHGGELYRMRSDEDRCAARSAA